MGRGSWKPSWPERTGIRGRLERKDKLRGLWGKDWRRPSTMRRISEWTSLPQSVGLFHERVERTVDRVRRSGAPCGALRKFLNLYLSCVICLMRTLGLKAPKVSLASSLVFVSCRVFTDEWSVSQVLSTLFLTGKLPNFYHSPWSFRQVLSPGILPSSVVSDLASITKQLFIL